MVYRSMGKGPGLDRIGAGVMDKSGLSVDQREVAPPTYSLVYVLRGRGTFIDELGRSSSVEPGFCFQRLPGLTQSSLLDAQSRWLEAFVDLGPRLYQALRSHRVLRPEPRVFRWGLEPARVGRFVELIGALQAAPERGLPSLFVRLLELVVDAQASAVAAAQPGAEPIERACAALGRDPAMRLGLRDWCRREGLDYERFRKEFRSRLGISPGQYRIRRRLDEACRLLQTTGLDLAAIAERLGYSSAYELSAQFSRHLGVAPSRYRAGFGS